MNSHHLFDAEYHINNEKFQLSLNLITNGVAAVKSSVKRHNFETARVKLGEVLRILQVRDAAMQ